MKAVAASANILRFQGTVNRAQYWAAGLAVVTFFLGSWGFVRMVGSATDSAWVALAIAVPILLALIYAVTALTVARLRHLGASLWWMVAWPLAAPVFWGIVGLLTIEASTEMKTLLAFRSHVSRGRFWTVGGWLLFVWVVWFYAALFLGLAGGWFPTGLMYAWFAFTPFALYAWTALVVGRLRDLRTSLWWVALWPLTAPVFWFGRWSAACPSGGDRRGNQPEAWSSCCSHPACGLHRGAGDFHALPLDRVEE